MRYWPAPAKINLFLHVTGRRADGYHTLQTVFQFLDFCDELAFDLTEDRTIARATPVPGVPEDADLCMQAAQRLQVAAGIARGTRIHLRKRIPIGGGLGGGSSDAATTLLALNALWGLDWPRARLAALGLTLGADVPVFIHGHAAWAEGVGEVLTPVEPPLAWYVVITPPVVVSTARVFADPELTRTTQPITIRDFPAGRLRNDLEPVACRLYPEVGRTLAWLGRFGPARMSGSGASVFLAVPSEQQGAAILTALRAEGFTAHTGFVARGVNVHPLHNAREYANWGVAKR